MVWTSRLHLLARLARGMPVNLDGWLVKLKSDSIVMQSKALGLSSLLYVPL